jgi:hypothetical protein
MRLAPLLLLAACTSVPASPIKTEPPAPVIEKPDPFYIPKFLAPDVVAVGTPFTVTLCGDPWAPGLQVKANGHLLGTMAHHNLTGCSYLIIPGLTQSGIRLLEAGLFERQIFVFSKEHLIKK